MNSSIIKKFVLSLQSQIRDDNGKMLGRSIQLFKRMWRNW
jgi:hypothetical protein